MVNQHHNLDISHQRGYALSSVALSALLVSSCHQIQLLLSLALPALFREDPLAYDDLQHPTPLLRVSVTMYETETGPSSAFSFSSSFHRTHPKNNKFRTHTGKRPSSHEIAVHIGLTIHTGAYLRPMMSTSEHRSLISRPLVPAYRLPFLSPCFIINLMMLRCLSVLFQLPFPTPYLGTIPIL